MGSSIRMPWLLILILVNVLFNNLSEAQHENKLPSAVVVGTVYCDTCFQQDFSKTSYFISDATVAVECRDGRSKPSFTKEVKTNNHGEFKIHLPFTVNKHVKRIEECSVKLISSSEPFCSVASRATSSSLHLKSRRQGVHIFSAGFFTFKPLKQPEVCNQTPSLEAPKELMSKKSSCPTTPGIPNVPSFTPTAPYMSPLPILPTLPPLPSVPAPPSLPPLVPGLPKLPSLFNGNLLSNKILSKHQNVDKATLFSPPTSLPPVFPTPPPPFGIPDPIQPTPLLPPIPFQPPPPPPPPLFNLPPVPGLSPPPSPISFPPIPSLSPPPSPISFPPIPRLSPPQPPTLPFPFLPFPFPPPRGFPGIPPAPTSLIKISSP